MARLLDPTASIQRQPAPTTAADVRDFVRATIDWFTQAASFFSLARLDAARFERTINGWYSMVIDGERRINSELGADPGLITALHTAYSAAVRALITRAASDLHRPEADLYRENRGRIPMWAWRTPHHAVAGISMPVAEGLVPNRRTGQVAFATNGFNVTIFPDAIDRSLGTQGKTRIRFTWGRISFSFNRRTGRITRVTGPAAPTVHIRTWYGPRANPDASSGYGRGTTPEDIAGGRVAPASTTLRFHEGSHGLDFEEFLGSNAPPSFTGVVGMTRAEFNAATAEWRTATRQYAADIEAFSTNNTDCVGTTIDEFNLAHARPRQRVELQCGH